MPQNNYNDRFNTEPLPKIDEEAHELYNMGALSGEENSAKSKSIQEASQESEEDTPN